MIANRIQSITVITPPATEPITLAEAKSYVHQAGDADNNLITAMIKAARIQCENYAAFAIGTQTRSWLFGHNAEREIKLLYVPTTVTLLEYRSCRLNPYTDITADIGTGWELTNGMFIGPLAGMYRMRAVAGDVPNESAINAVKVQFAFLYMNRGDQNIQQLGLCYEAASIMQLLKTTIF